VNQPIRTIVLVVVVVYRDGFAPNGGVVCGPMDGPMTPAPQTADIEARAL
jgi:hypothetical protein